MLKGVENYTEGGDLEVYHLRVFYGQHHRLAWEGDLQFLQGDGELHENVQIHDCRLKWKDAG